MKKALRNAFRLFQDMDKGLLIATTVLFSFGLLNIVTASSSEATANNTSLYYFFYQQLKMISIGVVFGIVILNIDTKKYPPFAILAYIIITSILLYLSFYGSDYRGARNWVQIGPVRFQPSEFAKPILIVCLSLMFEKNATYIDDCKNCCSWTSNTNYHLFTKRLWNHVYFTLYFFSYVYGESYFTY